MRVTLMHKLHMITGSVVLLTSLPVLWFSELDALTKGVFLLCMIVLSSILTRQLSAGLREGLDAMELGLLNLKDGEFATTLIFSKR